MRAIILAVLIATLTGCVTLPHNDNECPQYGGKCYDPFDLLI